MFLVILYYNNRKQGKLWIMNRLILLQKFEAVQYIKLAQLHQNINHHISNNANSVLDIIKLDLNNLF